jgi:cytoskeletal protein RodZ
MSILSDLDPKNAKIPAGPSPKPSRNTGLMLALLLLCGGVSWLYLAQPFATVGNVDSTLPPNQSPGSNEPLLASVAETTPLPAAATHEESGSALIQSAPATENAADASEASPNVFQELQNELDATPSAGTDTVTKPAARQIKASDKKSAKVSRAKKVTRSASAATGQRPTKTAANPSERDINIISAIVR